VKSLGETAARGTGVTLAGQACRAVLQMVSLVVLARLLAPEDFGLVAMVVSITGVADIIRDFGLSAAAVQARSLSSGERTNLFWCNLGIGLSCSAVVVAVAPLIVALYGEPRIGPVVYAVAGVFVVTGATTQFKAELSRGMRFRALVLADVVAQLLGIAAAIGLALSGAGFWAIVAQQIVVPVVTLVANVASCRWRPGLPRRGVPIRRFFRFGGGLLGTQLLSYLTKNIDNIAIGAYLGSVQLGLYSRGYQLLMTPLNQINAPLTQVALPVLSRVQDDDEVYGRYLRRAQIVGCYVTAPLFAVCAGLAWPLVELLFGDEWSAVAPVFAVLAVGGIFRAVAQLSYWIYLSRGLTGAQLRLFLVIRPIMIGLIFAGLPWGIVGVAAGCTAGALLQWLVPMWHVGRVAGVDARGLLGNAARALLVVSAPCGAVAALATLLPVPAAAQVGIGLVAVVLLVAVLARLVRPVRADLLLVLSYARRALQGVNR
jgi:O-antigen/teichoic acid export membrane protein